MTFFPRLQENAVSDAELILDRKEAQRPHASPYAPTLFPREIFADKCPMKVVGRFMHTGECGAGRLGGRFETRGFGDDIAGLNTCHERSVI